MEHGDGESDMEDEDSEIDQGNNACPHCGLLFSSVLNLAKHKGTCPQRPVPSSDIFGPIDDCDDQEDEEAWIQLIVYLNKKIRAEFEAKKQEYMAAGESDKRAHLRAKRDMKPQFKEDIKDFVRKSLIFVLLLRNSSYFEEIFEDLLHYKKEKGLTWEKAVPAALNRNSDVFGKILKDEEIAKDVRGERKDTEADDSADSDESMEDEDDEEEDEDAYKAVFP